jgi:hypothetical protein
MDALLQPASRMRASIACASLVAQEIISPQPPP